MLAGKRKTETTTEVNYRTGDERLVKLTDAAAAKVSGLLQRQGRPEGVLRVAVTGSELDYKTGFEDSGFKVNNPNAATTCSCGESFSA
jgi:Fe-S cluster assembly iron-binding protein IscA